MKNKAGGYEIRSFGKTKFHTSLTAKDVSVFKGKKKGIANVFESAFDFLSFLVLAKLREPDGDSFVLHSTGNAKAVAECMKTENIYREVRIWLDNDGAGTQAYQVFSFLLKENTKVKDMRYKYKGVKDLNEFLMHKSKAK